MSAVRDPGDLHGLKQRPAIVALSVLVALKVALLFIFSWHSRFVMDEFVQLGWAKYLGNGLFETIWHAKAVGYAVFFKFAHFIGWSATSILLIGRIQMALLACATLAIIFGSARALGENRVRALAVILVLLCLSNFIERIFRTIAEPLAVFFAAAALLVVLRGSADNRLRLIAAGILSGLAFLATQKSAYFNGALGLALVGDAFISRRYMSGIARGAWLVLGWVLAIAAYCFVFGGTNPAPVLQNLVFGPVEVATKGGDVYSGLGSYVTQTLTRNFVLYLFCFTGIVLNLLRINKLSEERRIALIFTTVITALVFAHNQPWPYVFIMALPFMALWSLEVFDRLTNAPLYWRVALLIMGIAVAGSFIRNVQFLKIDNRAQLDLIARAEPMVGPNDRYFDGVAMLPNRMEPSILWLDRKAIVDTLSERENSEAYRIFANSPPKVILWSYRMEAIDPVVGELIRESYVQIAPNIRIAGRQLRRGEPAEFNVPTAGSYGLYSETGGPLPGQVEVDGKPVATPIKFGAGKETVTLKTGPARALLLPEGSYAGIVSPGSDNRHLFDDVYN